ncbi:class I SAM-dependent methyltransferase [Mycolicibacterium sp. CBMA 226]|uniref:class I SAM-dependent methyltransferase n=1 Tax=Mycolicibacterium sp. CBMA 226 TaxID=2606611 RepID=UPI0012DEFFF9|nr:class I SAM-dependent methyltransferase [Mycolicibacterium sp. CBMA 226]MUL78169.1 class I SAM-dependent methyltransferase [Mycolicibacterium sp. CBMA 226]
MPVMSKVERAFCCGAMWRTTTRAVLDMLPADRLGERLLEIGSGSGAIAEGLASARPGLSITATDLDPVMVGAATQRLKDNPHVTVQSADATRLPFDDGAFDSVVSCLMMHHVIEWEAAVAEISRVLGPGGLFVGYDLTRTPAATVVHRVDRSPFRLLNPDELVSEGRRHGLRIDTSTKVFGHVMQFSATKTRH